MHKEFDYNQITEQIFLGTNMCCRLHYSEELLNQGVIADISLEKERVDAPFGVDYFLWLPVADHEAPTLKQIKLGVAAVDFFVRERVKLYVHCKNGHGRAPTLVIAYLLSTGMDADGALSFVKSRRPSIHPNERQCAALRAYAQLVHNDI